MANRLNLRRRQAGQILMYVIIVLALAAIIIPSVLFLTGASHRSTQASTEKLQEYYAADTGVEYALQQLASGNLLVAGCVTTINNPQNPYFVITSTSGGTTIVVHVNKKTLTINTTAGGNVTVSPPGLGAGEGSFVGPSSSQTFTYAEGSRIHLTAAPGACHDFVNWTGDPVNDPNNDGDATITMNGNYVITANFQWQTSLTVISGTGGNVSVTPPGLPTGFVDSSMLDGQTFYYCRNTTVDLVATPEGMNTFDKWTLGPVQNPNGCSTSIVMNGYYTVKANFASTPTWTLTISHTGNGTVTTPCDDGHSILVPKGDTVNLVATPTLPCNRFVNWTAEGPNAAEAISNIGNTSNPITTITMNNDYSIVANFAQIQYTLTINVNPIGGGTVTGSGTYLCGTPAPISATPTPGGKYAFVNWTGDTGTIKNGNVTDPNTTITMYGNYTIQANFVSLCNCFHYAAVTWGGDLNLPNGMSVNGDVYVQGNLDLTQGSRITGNAYATGDITFEKGNGATITGSAYAKGSIVFKDKNSVIQGDAWCVSISGDGPGSVLGATHLGTIPSPPFPIFTPPNQNAINAAAATYANQAKATGNITTPAGGTLTPSNDSSLGPVYINGNLVIAKSTTVNLKGTIFVTGTITVLGNIFIAPSGPPYAIVGNATGSTAITIDNGALVNAAYTTPLPVIMAVQGGIDASKNATDIGAVLYAPKGTVNLSNNLSLEGDAVGLVVTTKNPGTEITIGSGLDSRTDLPSCGCGP